MIFASRAFHRVEDAPFLLYCDHFVRAIERTDDRTVTLTLDGGETCSARLSFVRQKRRKLTATRVATADGDVLRPQQRATTGSIIACQRTAAFSSTGNDSGKRSCFNIWDGS
jgi:hypothetical protein